MSISKSLSRLADYYRRHGLARTIGRAGLAGKRAFFAGRMVIFYCDLNERVLPRVDAPKNLKVERITALTELRAEHLQEMTCFWNPVQVNRNIRERFEKGASLWLVMCEGKLASYGWTLRGATIEPYYFPLTQNDVHLFDFHVFPQYRGHGINPYLIGQILDGLATNGAGRAFIEAAEWNGAQLSSLRKTPFRCLGLVRTFAIFGQVYVSWNRSHPDMQVHTGAESKDHILKTARSNQH
jgi:GNAT superfamily N-acetyltransferase